MSSKNSKTSESPYEEEIWKRKAAEEEVRRLQSKLIKVEKERAEYLQNVAHQLSAPLHAIKGHIENITATRVGPDRGRQILSSIYSQSTIAVYMVKNFAFMSALATDPKLTKYLEAPESIHLKRMLVNIVNDFKPLANNYKVDFIIDDDSLDRLPTVSVVVNLMRQALSNLIDNAAKYSYEDSIVKITGGLRANQMFVDTVNQGVRITSNDIFKRGFRCDEAKSKVPAGTGYGLYITKKIIDIHKGKIEVRVDREGRQNTFRVYLPLD